MPDVVPITPDFAVTGALRAEEFDAVAAQGYRMIINFLPDHETKAHVSSEEARRLCEKAGLIYVHIPAPMYGVFAEDVILAAQRAVAMQKTPVLAYCASGQRAAIVWAAVSVHSMPVDTVLGTLTIAGFDLGYIRDDLELQADRPRWQTALGSASQNPHARPAA